MISNGWELFPVTVYNQILLIPDTEGTTESVLINWAGTGLNFKKMLGLSFPRDKANCLY